MPENIAFIFARGGSKGILNKNLQVVGGFTLVTRAIRCARESKLFDRIVVSTDSSEIASEALRHGAEVPELRPPHLATDDSPEIESWRHAITWFENGDGTFDFDHFVSVPPTTPLKRPAVLTSAVEALTRDCDIVISACQTSAHPSYTLVQVDSAGLAKLLLPPQSPIHRRQDTPRALQLCSAVYATTPGHVRNAQGVLTGRVRIIEVDRRTALDVDDEFDLNVAQLLAKAH